MSLRFSETDKWHKDSWFRKLKPNCKLLFCWLCDSCDIAGFWEVDIELAAYETGLSVGDVKGALKGLASRYDEPAGGVDWASEEITQYIWLKNFIKVQKNLPLNPANKSHIGIINRIHQHIDCFPHIFKALKEQTKKKTPSKPLDRGTGIGRGIGKGIGKGTSQKGGVGENKTREVWLLKQELDAVERLQEMTNKDEHKRELAKEKRELLKKIKAGCSQQKEKI